ncbi:MAG: 3-deoxy-8-phosphooctulonate synthase [Alphaproteobacteria bacterium]|nr:3-deoxy-8-phosphooctulonate synthase [Alphaproteobacteria bacterium]MBR6730311.1 3-deoxy-8-phosphooctulonate synthase [Alphaproteobacteria bacterium]
MQKEIQVANLKISNDRPFTLIAGPCQMESASHGMEMAEALVSLTKKLNIPFIFKASFDKANRTSISGIRGMGLEKAMTAFQDIKEKFNCPVITDIHEPFQCEIAAKVVDVLQIPAFLCRQTDLLIAAGKTNAAINVKKGQFLAPWDMKNVAAKLESTGNTNIMLTERGASFGYNTLVVDMRSLPIMKQTGYPVVFDATHSVQQPGGQGTSSGGQREFAPILANAAITTGIAGIFIETHETPDTAPSDGPNMIPLHQMEQVLKTLKAYDDIAKGLNRN